MTSAQWKENSMGEGSSLDITIHFSEVWSHRQASNRGGRLLNVLLTEEIFSLSKIYRGSVPCRTQKCTSPQVSARKRAGEEAVPALTKVVLYTVYNQRCAPHPSRCTARFWSLCQRHGVLFPDTWSTYCCNDFCVICVELSGSCKTVESGVELETVNTYSITQEAPRKASLFPGFLLLKM